MPASKKIKKKTHRVLLQSYHAKTDSEPKWKQSKSVNANITYKRIIIHYIHPRWAQTIVQVNVFGLEMEAGFTRS